MSERLLQHDCAVVLELPMNRGLAKHNSVHDPPTKGVAVVPGVTEYFIILLWPTDIFYLRGLLDKNSMRRRLRTAASESSSSSGTLAPAASPGSASSVSVLRDSSASVESTCPRSDATLTPGPAESIGGAAVA